MNLATTTTVLLLCIVGSSYSIPPPPPLNLQMPAQPPPGAQNVPPVGDTPFDAQPQLCCAPEKVEYFMAETAATVNGGQKYYTTIQAFVAADFSQGLAAIHELVDTEGYIQNITVIMNYKTGVMYVANPTQKTCQKTKVPSQEMGAQCLPADAQYIGPVHFGLGGGGAEMTAQCWTARYQGGSNDDTDLHVSVLMAYRGEKTCVPVMEYVIGKQFSIPMAVTVVAYEFYEGIRNPHVFDVPEYCPKTSQAEDELDGLVKTGPIQNYMMRKLSAPTAPIGKQSTADELREVDDLKN